HPSRLVASLTGHPTTRPAHSPYTTLFRSSAVNKATPTLTTTASGPVIVGGKIHDVAHLSGGFGTLGGTISFQVFAPGDTTCQTPIAVPPDKTVAGAGDYTSGDFTTSASGAHTSDLHSPTDADYNPLLTTSNDANARAAVNQAPLTLSTTASGPPLVAALFPYATLFRSGFGTLGGTISFQVFAPGDTTCQTPIAVPPDKTVAGAGDYTSGDFTTS